MAWEGDDAYTPGLGVYGEFMVDDRVRRLGMTGHETAMCTMVCAVCSHAGGVLRVAVDIRHVFRLVLVRLLWAWLLGRSSSGLRFVVRLLIFILVLLMSLLLIRRRWRLWLMVCIRMRRLIMVC